MNHRPLRVANLIQEEMNLLLLREFDAEGAFVTITGVEVDKKLEHARIKVGILPKAAAGSTVKNLVAAQGRLQYLLLRRINIKPMPRIQFVFDEGAENAARVEKILLDEDNDSARA